MSGPRKKPNSGPHVFLKNCSSGTDQRLLDADFDRYWDDESKNNNRNRIRVGRQYQATVPPLLKPGEADGRRCEDLETLKWKPDQEISDEQLDNYLSVVKAVSLFAKAIDIYQNPDSETGKCLQNALRGLSEFVTSHHPSESESGCQVSPGGVGGGVVDQSSSTGGGSSTGSASSTTTSSGQQKRPSPGWSFAEGSLFLKALDVCGKNFAAIKKDFLPWKPVRNLIEYYYSGQRSSEQQQQQSGSNGPHRRGSGGSSSGGGQEQTSSAAGGRTAKDLRGQASPVEGEAQPEEEEEEEEEEVGAGGVTPPPPLPPVGTVPAGGGGSAASPVSTSVPGIPAEPLDDQDTVGSLKFYLGGQMVLKLNARQESSSLGGEGGPRCQWVQSKDNCPKPPANVRKKRRKRQVNGDRHPNCKSSASGSDSEPGGGGGGWSASATPPSSNSARKKKTTAASCGAATLVSPKSAWTPPVERNVKCTPDSPVHEDKTGLGGS